MHIMGKDSLIKDFGEIEGIRYRAQLYYCVDSVFMFPAKMLLCVLEIQRGWFKIVVHCQNWTYLIRMVGQDVWITRA